MTCFIFYTEIDFIYNDTVVTILGYHEDYSYGASGHIHNKEAKMEQTVKLEKSGASIHQQCGNRVKIQQDLGRNKVDIQEGVIQQAYLRCALRF